MLWCVYSFRRLFEPANIIDICKLTLMIMCYFMLTFVDTSMIYHIIRGQAIIKLYIFYNMLEVTRTCRADKLTTHES